MESLLLLCLCLLTWSGTNGKKIQVKEGNDVVLPCSSNGPITDSNPFLWKKDGQRTVYESGDVNNVRQHHQFRGRVSVFPDQQQSGNASITIKKTMLLDSGTYRCTFSEDSTPRSTIELDVDCHILKDRTGENPVACPKPDIAIVDGSGKVKCEAVKTSPEPEVELWNSGTKIDAETEKISENGNIVLTAVVTSEDFYHCVVRQRNICHEIKSEETFVRLSGLSDVVVTVIAVLCLVIGVVVGGVAVYCYNKRKQKDSPI